MRNLCEKEITGLHRFFVEWMTGALPRNRKAFARAADALADDMTMITPQAEVMVKARKRRDGARKRQVKNWGDLNEARLEARRGS